MVHIGGATCGALSLSPLLAVTALITSFFINLAYLRHTPYSGPAAPWRDGDGKDDGALESPVGDRFLDGWRLCFCLFFLSFHFFRSFILFNNLSSPSPHLFYPKPYPTTPPDVGCTTPRRHWVPGFIQSPAQG